MYGKYARVLAKVFMLYVYTRYLMQSGWTYYNSVSASRFYTLIDHQTVVTFKSLGGFKTDSMLRRLIKKVL